MAEIRFVGKLTRSSKKLNTYVIYVPKSIVPLLKKDKYIVILRDIDEEEDKEQ